MRSGSEAALFFPSASDCYVKIGHGKKLMDKLNTSVDKNININAKNNEEI